MSVYAKAVVGALVAALTSVATALDDGSLTAQEWVTAAVALLVAFGAIWATPNKPAG